MRTTRVRSPVSNILLVLIMMHSLLFTASVSSQTPPPVPLDMLATGHKVSLDLKGVEILDVLKLLSQQSGLNFVAGPNVTGRVTIFAKGIDIWDAFERIVDANDLAYDRRGPLINVMTARDYELLYGEKFQTRTRSRVMLLKYAKANQLATVLNQLKSSVGRVVVDEASETLILTDTPRRLEEMQDLVERLDRPTETRVYTLNYADPEKLKDKIQALLTPIGTLSVDARTSKLIVTDIRATLSKIAHIIEALDEQEREVLIEAKIIKVELSDEQRLGIDWQRVFAGVDTKVRGSFRVLGDVVEGGATGAALKFVSTPSGDTQILIEALKKFGKVETVSNPRIAVSNNQEAKILVGTKEAFVTVTTTVPTTGSVVTSPQIQFVDVGTKLFVTPRIKGDGHVQLKIRPEVSTAKVETFQTNRIPIVTTTEAETNVLIRSGSTLVIGGLIDSRLERNRNQVPVLGDLPMLGAIFRSHEDTSKKTELVVFLTPQIISASGERVTRFPSRVVERIADTAGGNGDPVPVSYQTRIRTRLRDQLAQHLQSVSLGEGSVAMAFLLNRDGRVIGSPEIVSPEGEVFVRAAQAALDAAAPFPPFPEGSTASQARFHMTVDYR